ncbi:MAG: hemolysin III family protein [Planctomycetia bacterium]|nr:hemolysin III family protein [Planctomycetia bacterium]
MNNPPYPLHPSVSVREEIANAVSHGVGALLSLVALILLVISAINVTGFSRGPVILGFTLFGLSLLFLYLMSTLYHSFPEGRVKATLQELDHAAIFVLIAGSYSAFCLSVLYESIGIWMFWTIWALAAIGILSRFMFGKKSRKFALILYLIMGWLIISQYSVVISVLTPTEFYLILAGGITYTVGFIFYALQKLPWMHPIWHLFVLGGSTCHVLAALLIV